MGYNCFIAHCPWQSGSQLIFRAYIRYIFISCVYHKYNTITQKYYPIINQPVAMAIGDIWCLISSTKMKMLSAKHACSALEFK